MCKHIYTANYAVKPRSMGHRCPCPELYRRVRPAASDKGSVEELLLDKNGICIFHSQEISWKRQNDFSGKFHQLLQMLIADQAAEHYDFAEFIFVGSENGRKGGEASRTLRIADLVFPKQAYFTAATFIDSLLLENVDFQDGAQFGEASFRRDLRIRMSHFRGLDFGKVEFAKRASFTEVDVETIAFFADARFTGATVRFQDSRLRAITDFSGAFFDLDEQASVNFQRTRFEDFVDFSETHFHCQVVFGTVYFNSSVEFIDTLFDTVRTAARYRGAGLEFNGIELAEGAVLTFKSTDPNNKMFNHAVQMSFVKEPTGIVRFENVNFSKIARASRDRLIRLAKLGRVEIGAGCIKYRFQTPVRSISISQNNEPLLVELCQTFTHYFTACNGFNLGFEILERNEEEISFFYFTDEDITEQVFQQRLAHTERNLWNLLAIRSDEQLPALKATGASLSTGKEKALINAVDGLSALMGTFFRVGVRIALGSWKNADTQALLGAIQFNKQGAEERAAKLHRVLVDHYTGRRLVGINRRQNQLLAPMTVTGGKVKILFAGANSSASPLRLEEEAKKIQSSLKSARERRNLEFKQEWAVTIDSLTQAMLDESPSIVHFAGHGTEGGIFLKDELGLPKTVSAQGLSELFRLFKDSLICVVLNSCYSEPQARAIRQHIPHVIGMSSDICDAAAIAFSSAFYKAIGAGREIPFAFDLGKAVIELEGIGGGEIPLLL